MRWSFKVARIAGIEVRIHITFFLLLAWVGWAAYKFGGPAVAGTNVLFILLIFLSVLLHEFGHALTAARYGIRTPDITLLPIGGVARLERMPENPREEIMVALAGPAVNVLIAAVLLLFILPWGGPSTWNPFEIGNPSMVQRLMLTNLWLVLFNMIPAFPMDGGRVLRALLALNMSYGRATAVAATIGQSLAFFFGFIGLITPMPMLLLIAVFIYFGAASEASFAQMRDLSRGLPVSSVMVTTFQSLPENATLDDAIEALLATSQHDFPIVGDDGHVLGMLARQDLIVALRKRGPDTPVSSVMRKEVPSIGAGVSFEYAFTLLQEKDLPALPVHDAAGRLIGLFTPENVGEMLMIREALHGRRSHSHHLEGVEDSTYL